MVDGGGERRKNNVLAQADTQGQGFTSTDREKNQVFESTGTFAEWTVGFVCNFIFQK